MEGPETWYYESGKIRFETIQKDGQWDGLLKGYSESGKIEREVIYLKGKREGTAKYFLQNSAVIEIQHRNGSAVSGFCVGTEGKRTPLTNPEITYFTKGEKIICE
jgi:hypothetical protein